MKGQSAIEYLITYGWMLVAVAIASSAIYSLVGDQCVDSSTGFESSELQVQDFGVTDSGDLSVEVQNTAGDEIRIQSVNATLDGEERNISVTENISSSRGEVLDLTAFQSSSDCNSIEIEMIYSVGVLTDQYTSGTLNSQIEFIDIEEPEPFISVSSSY